MKRLLHVCFLTMLLLFGSGNLPAADTLNIPEYLQSISVVVKVKDGAGCGTVFTRKDSTGTNDITFVWTASHLFVYHDDVFSIIFMSQTGTNAPIIDHAQVEQNIVKDGEVVGKTNRLARLIKFSNDDTGQDLALLQLDGAFFNTNSVKFDLSGKIPRVGTPLFAVGSPFGMANTFSTGVFSYIGRKIDNTLFDQTSCVVYPGSSGGGVYLTDGEYEGMTTIMKAPSINFDIPIRRIQKWAKSEHVEWALDPNLPIPTAEQLKKLPLQDADYYKVNTNSLIIQKKK